MTKRIPITPRGKRLMQDELHRLKAVERPANVKAIEEARAHGDLFENAEYHAAKEMQGQIDFKIKELEDRLGRAEVIDPASVSTERVVFGTKVILHDLEQDHETAYSIVGEWEADPAKGLISIASPIARGLIGKEEGDEVTIKTPKGLRQFEVVSIERQENDQSR